MTYILSSLPLDLSLFLAQARTSPLDQINSNLLPDLGLSLLNLLKGLIILLVGWLVAELIKRLVKGILNATDIDNRIASWTKRW